MASSLPYHEPPIETLLLQSSFLLALNAVNHVLDGLIYCGLIGQILIGIAWGVPGGNLLSVSAQEVIVQLGYLGLIMLVIQGGLSTSFSQLKANLLLSIAVALTGIAVPMGLSFLLTPMVGASALQAFAVGAALCSTSLGTTFTLLGTSGLSASRLGVVLSSAAMMDDVVGLIMVQIVSNLGGSSTSLDPIVVIRPVFVSLAFAVLIPLACRFVVMPVTRWLSQKRQTAPRLDKLLRRQGTALVTHTAVFVGMVAGATYAGSSSLLGAYIAGAVISWWDEEAPHALSPDRQPERGDSVQLSDLANSSDDAPAEATSKDRQWRSNSGAHVFETYYQPALDRVLKPFFFASIGFSIPVAEMFSGPIVWRGIVFSILMAIGKLVCGLWLLPLPSPVNGFRRFVRMCQRVVSSKRQPAQSAPIEQSSELEKPLTIYPGLILGSAMVARGEIGYLISSLAESTGIFGNSESGEPSQLFLITTWAITLCTVAGPVAMGYLVNRVRGLEKKAADSQRGRHNVLGSWGID